MAKRKHSDDLERDLGHLMRKIQKLERKIRRKKNSSDREEISPTQDSTLHSVVCRPETPQLIAEPVDWLINPPEEEILEPETVNLATDDVDVTHDVFTYLNGRESVAKNNPITDQDAGQNCPGPSNVEPQELDTETLEILGADPTSTNNYGSDIHKELSLRFQHIVQEGISKELKKEIVHKYPLPANCLLVGAPTINPEIKAALPELIIKRDKGIEIKQKQMASAISCLGQAISTQLNSNQKDKELLQKLMDLSRLMCDIQHSDSITGRHFILSALKKDMREHLTNTKVDTFLFGDKLAETLKSAKAVNKSGVDLKVNSDGTKNLPRRTNTPASRPLNRRAPAPARRQPGTGARFRQPAAARPLILPPQPPGHLSRTSWVPPPPPPPAPPPPTQQLRRRY